MRNAGPIPASSRSQTNRNPCAACFWNSEATPCVQQFRFRPVAVLPAKQRRSVMVRSLAVGTALLALVLLIGPSDAGAQKAQMVKGTLKLVDSSKDLLVVNQKVKNEVVDRELSILASTEFVINIKGEKKELTGSAGLKALEAIEGRVGAPVQVKCDKDVNVLKVTVTIK